MISVPLWIVVLFAVLIAGSWWTNREMKNDGNYGYFGCVAGLVSFVAVLVVLLAHAWGWV